MAHLLAWLDESPARYESLAWAGFAVLLALAALPAALALAKRRPNSLWLGPWMFVAAVLLCTAAFRWPSVLDNEELQDPDESQMIAAAITLRHDPLFLRSVDGATCGPVDEVPLTALAALGVRVDYRVAHAAALGLTLAGVLATWLALRRLFGDPASRMMVLPLVAAVAFCDFNQLLHYSTEQCPAALVAIAFCSMVRAWDPEGRLVRPGWLAGCGLALGAVPFAKLQGAPVALFVALGAFILIGATPRAPSGMRLKAALLLACAGLALPLVFLAGIWSWGQWGEFSRSYIIGNIGYLSGRMFSWSDSPFRLLGLVRVAPGFGAYLLPGTAFVLLAAAVMLARPSGGWPRRMAVFTLGLLLASAFAVVAPGRDFFHYLHFLYFPAALCMGCFFGYLWQALGPREGSADSISRAQALCSLCFLGLCVGPQLLWRVRAPNPYEGFYAAGRSVLSVSEAAREILRHGGQDDSVAIWGWTPRLWVETGLRQGTRDGNTIRQIEPGGLQVQYLQRYLRDLERNRPAVFVDAVGGKNFLNDRAGRGIERFPAIMTCISAEYRFVREVEGTRVYVRKDLP
jgi:hypothetical protein